MICPLNHLVPFQNKGFFYVLHNHLKNIYRSVPYLLHTSPSQFYHHGSDLESCDEYLMCTVTDQKTQSGLLKRPTIEQAMDETIRKASFSSTFGTIRALVNMWIQLRTSLCFETLRFSNLKKNENNVLSSPQNSAFEFDSNYDASSAFRWHGSHPKHIFSTFDGVRALRCWWLHDGAVCS